MMLRARCAEYQESLTPRGFPDAGRDLPARAGRGNIREIMAKKPRKPRVPGMLAKTPVLVDDGEIIATMNHWAELFREVMTSEAGQLVMQNFLRQKISAGDPEAFGIILLMARAGHRFAWLAAKDYVRHVLNYDPNPSAQVRAYAIELIDMPEPVTAPANDEVVDNLVRDAGIRVMVDEASGRWPFLPQYNSTEQMKSVAHYVAVVFGLSERQVRRICQGRGQLADRLAAFLMAERKRKG